MYACIMYAVGDDDAVVNNLTDKKKRKPNLQHCPVHMPLTSTLNCPFNLHAQLISTNFPRICCAN